MHTRGGAVRERGACPGRAEPAGRARALSWFLAAALVLLACLSPTAAYASTCAGGALQIVAHEDDDLLFQSPDVLADIEAGRCVRTIYVTAGDAAQGSAYWHSRERGSQAAYAQMAGVANEWTTSSITVAGSSIRLQTLTASPQISLAFMRLPDGNRSGTGMVSHHHESLMRLWESAITSISAVDGSASYTDASLRSTLTALMVGFRPTTIRTQDWVAEFGQGDNADHIGTALYTRAAAQGYDSAHTLISYGGYPTWTRLPNVSGAELTAKQAAFHAYAAEDSSLCLRPWCADDLVYSLRLVRQYITATESPANSARRAGVVATASSQNRRAGQVAGKAVDGIALGFPSNRSKEWATVGGTSGSWIQLDYPTPTTINGVVLADRPNLEDQITGAVLQFSDGSEVATGPLPNNGSAVSLSFSARTTTSVRLTDTSVSATTRSEGLAELETYATMP